MVGVVRIRAWLTPPWCRRAIAVVALSCVRPTSRHKYWCVEYVPLSGQNPPRLLGPAVLPLLTSHWPPIADTGSFPKRRNGPDAHRDDHALNEQRGKAERFGPVADV